MKFNTFLLIFLFLLQVAEIYNAKVTTTSTTSKTTNLKTDKTKTENMYTPQLVASETFYSNLYNNNNSNGAIVTTVSTNSNFPMIHPMLTKSPIIEQHVGGNITKYSHSVNQITLGHPVMAVQNVSSSCGCAALVQTCPPCSSIYRPEIPICGCAPKLSCPVCPPLSMIHEIAAKKVINRFNSNLYVEIITHLNLLYLT